MISSYLPMNVLAFFIVAIILIVILVRWDEADKPSKIFALGTCFVLSGLVFEIVNCFMPADDTVTIALLATISSLFGCVTTPAFAYYSVYQANKYEKVMSIWIARIILIVNSIDVCIAIVGAFIGNLYVFEGDIVVPGPVMLFIYGIELASSLFVSIAILCHAKKLGAAITCILLGIVFVPFIGAIIEASGNGIDITYASLSISVVLQYVLVQSRIVNEVKVREQIENEISRTDELTGLMNRRAYSEYMDRMDNLVNAGAIFFDVNNLKKTNDELGHAAGDQLLIRFADVLRENLVNADIFRISGDEFVAVYPGIAKKKDFDVETALMRSEIKKHDDIASIGAYYAESMNIFRIVAEAEQLMYDDKAAFYARTGLDRRRR